MRGGAFLKGKEGRVGFRKSLKVKGGLVGFRKKTHNSFVITKNNRTFVAILAIKRIIMVNNNNI